MKNQPLVSIVLPAFNAEGSVKDAIVSILLQTYQNWELLFIDDGSSDRTLAVARSFRDERIRIFADGKNKGLPARLNEGIAQSAGKYIARMDNDDICFPDRLKAQVEFMEGRPEIDLVGVRAITFISPAELVGEFPFMPSHDEICARPWAGFYLPHPTWMGRAEWFKKYQYNAVDKAEDQELLLRSYQESRFACLSEFHFAYRLRSDLALAINNKARRSLLKNQIRIFFKRKQWHYLVMSILTYALKRGRDRYLATFNPKVKPGKGVRPEVVARWEELLGDIRDFAGKN